MKKIEELTQNDIHEFITYDPENGKVYWKERDIKWFDKPKNRSLSWLHRRWNTSFANKEACNISKTGHLRIVLLRKCLLLHRVIWFYMTGEWPKNVIDHINGNPSDNR